MPTHRVRVEPPSRLLPCSRFTTIGAARFHHFCDLAAATGLHGGDLIAGCYYALNPQPNISRGVAEGCCFASRVIFKTNVRGQELPSKSFHSPG